MTFLPSTEKGYLPYFLLYTSVSALIHSFFTYATPLAALRQFAGPSAPPKHSLLAHVYGVKNVYTGLIRLYAAYHITNPELYSLAIWTFVGVLALYSTEHLVYRTVGAKEAAIPYATTAVALVWMLSQKGWYLEQHM